MKFNTVIFNANLPTTQQVNIPTNTDYKVGIKVRKDGEVQDLQPGEITIYTGETITGKATDFSPASRNVTKSTGTNILATVPAGDLTAYLGQTIRPTDVKQTKTVDGATTDLVIPVDSDMARAIHMQYVKGGTVAWYQNGRKWVRYAGGEIVDSADTMTVESGDLMRQNGLLDDELCQEIFGVLPTAGGPVTVATTLTFRQPDTAVTVPPDEDRTNGYVTFTGKSLDDAECRQYTIEADHPETPATDETLLSSCVNSSGSTMSNMGIDLSVADYPGLAGKTVTPKDIYIANIEGSSGTAPTDAEIKADLGNLWDKDNASVKIAIEGVTTNYLIVPASANRAAYKQQLGIDTDEPFFLKFLGNRYDSWSTEYTLGADDVIVTPKNRLFDGDSRGWGIEVKLDDAVPGWKSGFKLNLNIFKSQQGDLEIGGDYDSPTATFAGTYTDDTPFSFDVLVKES